MKNKPTTEKIKRLNKIKLKMLPRYWSTEEAKPTAMKKYRGIKKMCSENVNIVIERQFGLQEISLILEVAVMNIRVN